MGAREDGSLNQAYTPTAPAYVDAAKEFVEMLGSYSSCIVLRLPRDRYPLAALVAKAVIERQRLALSGVLILGQRGIGALGGTFVRQACEEQVWLNYLSRLENEDADDLVLAMAHSDNMRGLHAFREYAGPDALAKLGFPPGFAEQAEGQAAEALARLKALRTILGWPKGPVPPRIEWVAEQVEELQTVQYLFSATSRLTHFSAGEAIRNFGWFDAQEGLLHMAAPRADHQYAFALQNLIEMGTKALVSAFIIVERAGIGDIPDLDPLLKLARRSLAMGRVPLVAPEEYNLTEAQRVARNARD